MRSILCIKYLLEPYKQRYMLIIQVLFYPRFTIVQPYHLLTYLKKSAHTTEPDLSWHRLTNITRSYLYYKLLNQKKKKKNITFNTMMNIINRRTPWLCILKSILIFFNTVLDRLGHIYRSTANAKTQHQSPSAAASMSLTQFQTYSILDTQIKISNALFNQTTKKPRLSR